MAWKTYICTKCNKTLTSGNIGGPTYCIHCGGKKCLVEHDGNSKGSTGSSTSINVGSSNMGTVTIRPTANPQEQTNSSGNTTSMGTVTIRPTANPQEQTNSSGNTTSMGTVPIRPTAQPIGPTTPDDVYITRYKCNSCGYEFEAQSKDRDRHLSCRQCHSGNTTIVGTPTLVGNTNPGYASGNVGDFFEGVYDGIVGGVKDFFSGDSDRGSTSGDVSEADVMKAYRNSLYRGTMGIAESNEDNSGNLVVEGFINDQEVAKNLEELKDTSGSLPIESSPINTNVFGMPLFYNSFADPCRSVYGDTFIYDMPLVFITPGKPKVNRKLISKEGDKIMDLDEYYNESAGHEDIDDPGMFSTFGILGPKNSDDLRYMSFKSNYTEYWRYLQALTSYVHAWLISGSSSGWTVEKYDITEEFKNVYKNSDYGIPFYADRATTFSENVNNSYGTSRIADMTNEQASITREASVVGKYNGITKIISEIGNTIKNAINGLESLGESVSEFEKILTKTSHNLVKVVNGAQLNFPQIWQDSTFDRSYNLNFRFYSPYGDRWSIEKYVYTPFLALLTFALSRQDQSFSYIEPMLVRVNVPGAFEVDMGVITSMTINKGGSDNLWTSDNLPRLIEVSLEIQDLYPALTMSCRNKMYKYNKNLSSYLECMGGIRAEALSWEKLLNFKVNRFISNSILVTWDDTIKNKFEDWQYSVNSWVTDLLK